jgi:uncharacterized LabA/DUF88 family protein
VTATLAGFVDVGFVRAALGGLRGVHAGGVRVNAAAVTALITRIAAESGDGVLRTYWYDGCLPPSDPRYTSQRRYLDAVARVPGVRLRLGDLVERTPPWQARLLAALDRLGVDRADLDKVFPLHPELVQKGVDTLMAVDLVTLAYRNAVRTVCMITGDRDLEPALSVVANLGCRIVLVTLPGKGTSTAVRGLADEVVALGVDDLRALDFTARPASSVLSEAPADLSALAPVSASRSGR